MGTHMNTQILGVVVAALLVQVAVAGQAVYDRSRAKEPGAKTWLAVKAKLPFFNPPRTRDGKPNLEGRWGGSSSGDDIEETDYIDVTTPPAESWVADTPDGEVPYQPWALAARNAHRAGLARGWPGETGERLYVDPQTFCLKSVPRYAQRGFELVQQPNTIVMMLNWGHYYRSISLAGRPHPGSTAKFWMGNPRGRWDGDTLVVETTNYLNGFQGSTPDVKLTERYTRVSPDFIHWETTVEDPATWTKPYTFMIRLKKASGLIYEYACHEGNYAMEGILAGARAEEGRRLPR
jgi:hypothetical protein